MNLNELDGLDLHCFQREYNFDNTLTRTNTLMEMATHKLNAYSQILETLHVCIYQNM